MAIRIKPEILALIRADAQARSISYARAIGQYIETGYTQSIDGQDD
jgi:hypothetical protein